MTSRPYTLLAVGELLADFIGHYVATSLLDSVDFRRFQGGSPANMAANMARLGNKTAMIACVGNDNIGRYVTREISETGVDTQFIAVDPLEPTTIVLVSRTAGTPDFVAYRHADCQLVPSQIPNSLLEQAQIFHTTCFALSHQPAQDTIVDAAKRAQAAGCQVSIDANYAPAIWPDRKQAWRVLTDYCSSGALVKLSEDDAFRLYGEKPTTDRILSDFHDMGALIICLTLGREGSIVSYENGAQRSVIPGKKVDVVDVTGAGDAYWAGFLTAFVDGKDPEQCAKSGAVLAQMKLTRQGPLPGIVNREVLYQ